MFGPECLDAHGHRLRSYGLLPPQLGRTPSDVREVGQRGSKTGRRLEGALEYGSQPRDLAVAQREGLPDGARLAGTHALERGMNERLDLLTVSSLNLAPLLGLLKDPSSQTGDLTQELGLLAGVEAEPLAEHLKLGVENVVRESLKPGHGE